jgi:hypothetical protein
MDNKSGLMTQQNPIYNQMPGMPAMQSNASNSNLNNMNNINVNPSPIAALFNPTPQYANSPSNLNMKVPVASPSSHKSPII